MTRAERKVCERKGWIVREEGSIVELEQTSPAGEDFVFDVSKNNFAHDVYDFAFAFDPDEHASDWIIAKRNSPNRSDIPRASVLVEDAFNIAEMLDELAYALMQV